MVKAPVTSSAVIGFIPVATEKGKDRVSAVSAGHARGYHVASIGGNVEIWVGSLDNNLKPWNNGSNPPPATAILHLVFPRSSFDSIKQDVLAPSFRGHALSGSLGVFPSFENVRSLGKKPNPLTEETLLHINLKPTEAASVYQHIAISGKKMEGLYLAPPCAIKIRLPNVEEDLVKNLVRALDIFVNLPVTFISPASWLPQRKNLYPAGLFQVNKKEKELTYYSLPPFWGRHEALMQFVFSMVSFTTRVTLEKKLDKYLDIFKPFDLQAAVNCMNDDPAANTSCLAEHFQRLVAALAADTDIHMLGDNRGLINPEVVSGLQFLTQNRDFVYGEVMPKIPNNLAGFELRRIAAVVEERARIVAVAPRPPDMKSPTKSKKQVF